jgi:hypothetical protein
MYALQNIRCNAIVAIAATHFLHSIVMQSTTLHYTTLHCDALHCTKPYHEIRFEVPKIRIDHLGPPREAPVLSSALKDMPAREDGQEHIRHPVGAEEETGKAA